MLQRTMIQTNLDERGAAKEETKHVSHNVITDHTGNRHNEPMKTKESSHQSRSKSIITCFMKKKEMCSKAV